MCVYCIRDSLHYWRHQVRHDLHRQDHLHDGPRLHLPISVRQSARHGGHQTCQRLDDIQPRLSLHHDAGQCHPAGIVHSLNRP